MTLAKKIATKYHRSDGAKKSRTITGRAARRASKRAARNAERRIALADAKD
jgi:hypothetical protein